jgi:hypothetical protein
MYGENFFQSVLMFFSAAAAAFELSPASGGGPAVLNSGIRPRINPINTDIVAEVVYFNRFPMRVVRPVGGRLPGDGVAGRKLITCGGRRD